MNHSASAPSPRLSRPLSFGLSALAAAAVCGALGWLLWPAWPEAASAGAAPSGLGTTPDQRVDVAAEPAHTLPARALVGSRYQLQGVMAGTAADGDGGVALIAVDGAPSRAFRVGEAVGDALVLLGVSPGGAILGPRQGPAALVLAVTEGTRSPLPGATTGPTGPTGALANGSAASALATASLAAGQSADAGFAPDPSPAAGAEASVQLPANDLVMGAPRTAVSPTDRAHPGRHARLGHPNQRP
jgi:hypothetical protein